MSTFIPLISAYSGALAIFNPKNTPQKNYNLYVNTQTLILNDAFSLKGLFHDFDGKFNSQTSDYKAIGDIRYDVGLSLNNGFYIGYAYREEAVMQTSSDTMKLVNQVSNELDLPIGKEYQINLAIEGFATHSLVFSKTIPLYHSKDWKMSLGLGVELLHGIQTQNGEASGLANVVALNDYDFSWNSHYVYTENYLYDLEVPELTSFGYTTHLALYLSYRQFSLDIIVNDASGKLYWKNLPYSDVTLSSSNKSYDENGYVVYAPTISGFEGSQKYTQILMQKWRVEGKYSLDFDSMQIGTDYIYHTYLPYIEYTHKYENNIISTVSYETYFHMVGVDIRYENYYFSIQTNDIAEPSAMKLDLGFVYLF